MDALVVAGASSEITVGINAFGIKYYRDGRLPGAHLAEKCWKSLKSKVLSEITAWIAAHPGAIAI